jgi:hypothetical protein
MSKESLTKVIRLTNTPEEEHLNNRLEIVFSVGADIKKQVASIKRELTKQTKHGVEACKTEYKKLIELFEEKTSQPLGEISFSATLGDYIAKIEFLFELTKIFERIERYCDFVTEYILPFMVNALEKIRLAYGCDLSDPKTWGVAQLDTNTISKTATSFDISRSHLRGLYDHVYDEMEWFSMSYNAADLKAKESFFAELGKTPHLLAWAQPWIEIAEGKETHFETALIKSMEIISNEQDVVHKQQVH